MIDGGFRSGGLPPLATRSTNAACAAFSAGSVQFELDVPHTLLDEVPLLCAAAEEDVPEAATLGDFAPDNPHGFAGICGCEPCRQDSLCAPCSSRRIPRYEFRDDVDGFAGMLKEDARAVATWENGVILGASLAASIAIREELDGRVRENTLHHPERWGEGSHVLGKFGEPWYQAGGLAVLYAYSLHSQDADTRDVTVSLISAFTLTGLSTLAIKGVANTDRPSDDWNDGEFGFPSFHTASTFAFAAVLHEYYGWGAGIPAYAAAGLIGWSRIDERDHDLSDVVFGAALGCVIGHAVAGRHLSQRSRFQVHPYVHPTTGASGLQLETCW